MSQGMNELQKEYFERAEKERAEAEAAEEARLLKVLEAEREKDAKKAAAAKKAKEEADRKAEEEAIEIINRVKAEVAANKIKEAEAKKQAELEKQKAEKKAESMKRFEEDQKAKTMQKPESSEEVKEPEISEKDKEPKSAENEKKPEKAEQPEKAEASSVDEEEETSIYEREPVGEASMPKKSPKFKKGGKKSTGAGKVPQRPQPQEAAATDDTAEAVETAKESEPVNEEKVTVDAEVLEETVTEKATPESKAAADREAKLQELADEWQDKYKRLLAEFENARAREAKEASRMYDVGAKGVLEKLLPVVDNFERAIQTIPEEDKERAFEQGVDKIYKQMMTTLEEIGVQPMNAEGTEFNPDLHNAVMHVEDEAFGENVVAEEMQKGYMYKDSVLRYSMVKVAN